MKYINIIKLFKILNYNILQLFKYIKNLNI